MSWHRHPGVRSDEQLTAGERAADRMRNGMGSWGFVFGALAFLAVWMVANGRGGFDPYPFILLNLVLSCLAAMQGAILLIAAKRSDQVSSELAQHDYEADVASRRLLTTLGADFAALQAQHAEQGAQLARVLRMLEVFVPSATGGTLMAGVSCTVGEPGDGCIVPPEWAATPVVDEPGTKAAGGPVSGGVYLVGEQGPEIGRRVGSLMRLRWADRPDKGVYRAAREQLVLVMPRSSAMELVQLLRDEPAAAEVLPSRILLAARVLPLPASDRVVRRVLAGARAGQHLAPVLLVRSLNLGGALLIADGYDRVSGAHHARPGDPVPCRIVTMERSRS